MQTLNHRTVIEGELVVFEQAQYTRNPHLEMLALSNAHALAVPVAQKTDADNTEVADLFASRTEGLRVYLDRQEPEESFGYFSSDLWSIVIKNLRHPRFEANTLLHETAHAVAINQSDVLLEDYDLVHTYLNGISKAKVKLQCGSKPNPVSFSGRWLNEGLMDLAAIQASTIPYETNYLLGTSVLSAVFTHNPEVETQVYESAFLTGEQEKAIEAIENVTFPGWVDEIGFHFEYHRNHAEIPAGYNPGVQAANLVPDYLRLSVSENLRALRPSR